jgi:hypothetical protein
MYDYLKASLYTIPSHGYILKVQSLTLAEPFVGRKLPIPFI